MLFIIPHSSTLVLSNRPYITWAVILICLFIHLIDPSSESLRYFPQSWNPLTMLSSSLAHGDWPHLLGNLVFFYAFSPMLEEAVNNKKRYLLILIFLSIVTGVSYSLSSIFVGENIPTLGLSGVVMGVIGLTAFMMPKAKIVTFIWFITYIKNNYISAWILALWYIGWDIFDLYSHGNNSGINLVSHVSGGVAGYLIGYYALGKQKEAIKDDVDDAIEYARSRQHDTSSMASTFSGNRKQMIEVQRVKDAKRKYESSIDQIYQQVELGQDSNAIILMLQNSEERQYSIEIYDELFERMTDWVPSRLLMCTGRFCIDSYMHTRIYDRPLEIATHCYTVSDDFVLADPMHVIILARYAISIHHYEAAYALVKNANQRYGNDINQTLCSMLEIELLWMHLNKSEQAKALIVELLKTNYAKEHHDAIMQLAQTMQV